MSGTVAFVVEGVEKRYGGTTVLENAGVSIHQRTKVGIIGRNGAGKSTLCRLLLGHEEPDAGVVTRADGLRVGYLEQHDLFELDETADAFLQRHTGAEAWRCGQVADKLGLTPEDMATTMGSLSGGYRTRVKLTAMLLADPDFLVLDEPTNFLDLSTVLLLQEFLSSFRGGLLVVSHDREFLKATCDHTLLVERAELTLYRGNVEDFFVWKAEQIAVAQRTNASVEAQRKHLQSFIDRFGAKNTKATQAKSKAKQIERLKPIEVANPLATARIMIPSADLRPGMAIAGEHLTIGYPDHTIARDVTMVVNKGDKVAIVGDNGQGKTTLLRTLAGDLPELAGEVKLAHGAEIAYYAQHVYQALDPEDTVMSHLERNASPLISRQELLAMAGTLLFRGDDVEKRVSVLSGGERARLCLAGLLLAKHPILVLDEPTNHLDFETVEALGDALHRFDGAVLFVSHDRTFVNMAATQVVEVHEGRVRVVPGTYADYVEELQIRARDRSAPVRTSRRSGRDSEGAAAHAERKRKQNERKSLQRNLRALDKRLAQLAGEKKAAHEAIKEQGGTDPALYQRLADIESAIEETEVEWLETTEALEGAT